MRVCVRLAALAALLVAIAIALVYMRTDVARAGNRLHSLYREKRTLEKACCRLELAIARLKSPQRLREQAAEWRSPGEEADQAPDLASGESPGANTTEPLLAVERAALPP
jgi:hypothetical protein